MSDKLLSQINNRLHLLSTKNLWDYQPMALSDVRKNILEKRHEFKNDAILLECEDTAIRIQVILDNKSLTKSWSSKSLEKLFPSQRTSDDIELSKAERLKEDEKISKETKEYVDALNDYSEKTLKEVQHELNGMMKLIEEVQQLTEKDSESIIVYKYKTQAWFKVGVIIASGEMKMYQKKHLNNATQIAKDIYGKEFKKYRPTISSSMYMDSGIGGKDNIFNNPEKLQKIFNHCTESGIKMVQSFLDKTTGL